MTDPSQTMDQPGTAPHATSIRPATFWVVFQMGAAQLIRLAANILLARLVAPDIFAVTALALTLYSGLVMVTDVGLYGSLVKTRREDDSYIRTLWSLQILRGLLIWFASLILAGAVAAYGGSAGDGNTSTFGDERLPAVLALMSLVVAIDGFRSINILRAYKALRPRPVVVMELISQTGAVVVMLGLAAAGWGVWAVVAGNIASSLLMLIASFTAVPGGRMAWRLDPFHLRAILHFGGWVFASSILTFLARQLDKLVFAAWMLISDFGIYTIAASWVMTGILLLRGLLRKVFQPAFAAREHIAARQLYNRARLWMDGVCLLGFVAFFALSTPFFQWLYPKAYWPLAELTPILALAILAEPYRLVHFALLARGHSAQQFLLGVGHMVFLLAGLLIAVRADDLYLAVLAFAIAPIVSFPFAVVAARRTLGLNAVRELRMALLALVAVVLVLLAGRPALLQ